jgi:membrane-bound lytic murein transglycosylase D
VWQFIAATGKRYGLAQDWWVDERSDPEKATRAAAAYLKELYGMFGDWNLALAAYNAGELVVQRGIQRYRTSDFWQLSRTRALRRETRNYVPLIHAAIVVAKAPEKYGIELSPEAAPAYETRPVPGAVDLRVIAECLETPLQDLQQLNPELRRLATPANRTFELKVPQGRAEALGACLETLPPEKKVQFRTHTVARGQTLASIAQANGVRARDIADANGLSLQRRLAVGTELIIPIAPRGKAAPPVRQAAQTSTPPAKVPPADLAVGKPSPIRYTIKPGDTLTAIASQYGTTIHDLQTWNGLHGTRIAAGSTLTIYTTSGSKN